MNARVYLFALLLFTSVPGFGQSDFITVWDMSKPGQDPAQITFKATAVNLVSYTWQEISPGNASGSGTFRDALVTIAGLPANALIELRIQPAALRSFRSMFEECQRLIDIKQWGTVPWNDMSASFALCENLNISATDFPNLTSVRSLSQMFFKCKSLNSPANMGDWDVSRITSMVGMFQNATSFNQPIGTWNVSNVRDFEGLFYAASSFNQDISSWNVSNATDMSHLFTLASSFNQPIGNWQTAKVTDMSYLFSDATSFNQPIGNWDVSRVTNMSDMFRNAGNFNQDIHLWNVSNVRDMNSMFLSATAFNQPLADWNVHNVLTMFQMFFAAGSFDQSLERWAGILHPSVNLEGMLSRCGLSVGNYDATLVAFGAEGPAGRKLDATGLNYCAASQSRAHLVKSVAQGGKGWTISGDINICPMPVSLVFFEGNRSPDNQNNLEWVTADEIGFDRFEIQRTADAKSFETIGIVKGGTSSTAELSHYRFVDHDSRGKLYYRLKMVDTDGSFEFSKILAIQNDERSGAVGEFYPNPAREATTIDIYAPGKSEWLISTMDISGRLLQSQKAFLSPGINKIKLTMPKARLNFVRFESGKLVEVRRLISLD
ncbi:BspA family leucine-rich repeat surface protein [Dyadobacter aurulentus]|uniref:BspA family leucine-rich repeat surface protein n=1 Tax=Dyadobacter sp. UC 10 TaxID=2605428 RepID=UPI0011F2CF98|nr:BspA family leucine-rich repeat surface protein [Dyadobacter sp. UC 10]KAA0992090.1 BspA family leucine-rich repeat surface protein [Dyadobacter sp. UC 10]